MTDRRHSHDAVHWHMSDITARIIAESGIPSDRFHLGKIILHSLKDDPDFVLQIDGATGESETNGSVLRRSIQCALGFRKLGLQRGDVMILMAPNHLDLTVPFYAALFEGIAIAPVDRFLGVAELEYTLSFNKPNIIFCQSEKVADVQTTLNKLGLDAKTVSFDKSNSFTFAELLKLGGEEKEIQSYKPADFDPAETLGLLIATSGTTGLPKSAATTQKNFAIVSPYFWARTAEVPWIRRSLVASPLQWLTALLNFVCAPYMKLTRIQSSLNLTQEHAYHLINTYKPEFVIMSPTMLTTLLRPEDRDRCDFTSFKMITIGGSAINVELISELKKITPETDVTNLYGMSELAGMALLHGLSSPPLSCGKPIGCHEYRLVDMETGKDINEPNKNGELWFKGPSVFKGYYNNPEATKETFAEGGWLKSGDLFYRDESWNFYFVERIKLLLKYKNYQISPAEVEAVICQHPEVLDTVVSGIPDKECGDLLVACIVPKRGFNPDNLAQEIKDLVKESLTDTKQLRGGVVFLDQMPTTASTKVHRRKIKEMVLHMKRF